MRGCGHAPGCRSSAGQRRRSCPCRLRDADDVAHHQHGGDGGGLDRRRLGIAGVGDRLEKFVGEAEIGKAHAIFRNLVRNGNRPARAQQLLPLADLGQKSSFPHGGGMQSRKFPPFSSSPSAAGGAGGGQGVSPSLSPVAFPPHPLRLREGRACGAVGIPFERIFQLNPVGRTDSARRNQATEPLDLASPARTGADRVAVGANAARRGRGGYRSWNNNRAATGGTSRGATRLPPVSTISTAPSSAGSAPPNPGRRCSGGLCAPSNGSG